jgi:uncharacterized integral membrane protein
MSTQGTTPAGRETVPTWKLVVFGILAVYAILIVLLNRDEIEVSFVFFSAQISLLVLILLCVGIGFAAGYLFEQIRGRRKTSA